MLIGPAQFACTIDKSHNNRLTKRDNRSLYKIDVESGTDSTCRDIRRSKERKEKELKKKNRLLGKPNNKRQPKRALIKEMVARADKTDDSSSEENDLELEDDNLELEEDNLELDEDNLELEEDNLEIDFTNLARTKGQYIIVEYQGKKSRRYFVAVITDVVDDDDEKLLSVTFYKRFGKEAFVLNEDDTDEIVEENIVGVVKTPTLKQKGDKLLYFFDLSSYDSIKVE